MQGDLCTLHPASLTPIPVGRTSERLGCEGSSLSGCPTATPWRALSRSCSLVKAVDVLLRSVELRAQGEGQRGTSVWKARTAAPGRSHAHANARQGGSDVPWCVGAGHMAGCTVGCAAEAPWLDRARTCAGSAAAVPQLRPAAGPAAHLDGHAGRMELGLQAEAVLPQHGPGAVQQAAGRCLTAQEVRAPDGGHDGRPEAGLRQLCGLLGHALLHGQRAQRGQHAQHVPACQTAKAGYLEAAVVALDPAPQQRLEHHSQVALPLHLCTQACQAPPVCNPGRVPLPGAAAAAGHWPQQRSAAGWHISSQRAAASSCLILGAVAASSAARAVPGKCHTSLLKARQLPACWARNGNQRQPPVLAARASWLWGPPKPWKLPTCWACRAVPAARPSWQTRLAGPKPLDAARMLGLLRPAAWPGPCLQRAHLGGGGFALTPRHEGYAQLPQQVVKPAAHHAAPEPLLRMACEGPQRLVHCSRVAKSAPAPWPESLTLHADPSAASPAPSV